MERARYNAATEIQCSDGSWSGGSNLTHSSSGQSQQALIPAPPRRSARLRLGCFSATTHRIRQPCTQLKSLTGVASMALDQMGLSARQTPCRRMNRAQQSRAAKCGQTAAEHQAAAPSLASRQDSRMHRPHSRETPNVCRQRAQDRSLVASRERGTFSASKLAAPTIGTRLASQRQ